ncbi:MAG: GNAT family N-acetyltransferase [Paucibacter sp.]|nr:GNAT family N-acetyltransferase [Roseateles sp.]
MLISSLQFHILPEPPTAKMLTAFRKDAGWSISINEGTLHDLKANVQWAAVESGQRRLGIVRLELAPPEFCYVGDLIINSKFRGQGIGQWFIQRIEQYCRTVGIKRMMLQPEHGTEDFYARLSFTRDPYVPNFLRKDINPLLPRMFLPQS